MDSFDSYAAVRIDSHGASLPIGFVSLDPIGPGSSATFDISNQTGPNDSTYPDTTFRGRLIWYFAHAASLTALTVSLKYAGNPDLEEFARKRADLEVEAERKWAHIGAVKEPFLARKGR